MKLVQLNIWQGRILRKALDFLEKQQPDIICLQEVPSSDIKVPGFLETNTLQQVLQAVPHEHHAYAPRWQYALMGGTASYGMAIISRYPLSNEEVIFTVGDYNPDFVYGRDDHTMSNVQRVTIDCGGHGLTVYNHHGYHQLDPNGNETSIKSLARVASWTDETTGPLILAGDLNVWPQSPAIKPLDERFRNLTIESGIASTLNELGKVQVVCDYIFVNDQIKVQRFEVAEALVSDHKALILEFEL